MLVLLLGVMGVITVIALFLLPEGILAVFAIIMIIMAKIYYENKDIWQDKIEEYKKSKAEKKMKKMEEVEKEKAEGVRVSGMVKFERAVDKVYDVLFGMSWSWLGFLVGGFVMGFVCNAWMDKGLTALAVIALGIGGAIVSALEVFGKDF